MALDFQEDDIDFQPDGAPATASQGDVRKAEPVPAMERQDEQERQFNEAFKRWQQTPQGQYYPGAEQRERFAKITGRRDPRLDRSQAEVEHAYETDEVNYEGGVNYSILKPASAVGGFALGGPMGATAAEALVRATTLGINLDKAVKAGAITEDRAWELLTKEMLKGTGEDALFNFGVPLLGQLVMKIPGATWIKNKLGELTAAGARKIGITPPAPKPSLRDQKLAERAELTDDPARKAAIAELGKRTEGVVMSPGQVAGEAGYWESTVRRGTPSTFVKADQQFVNATDDMLREAHSGATQPKAKALGLRVQETAESVQQAVKNRLRPAFEAADNLGVKVDLRPVAARAQAALAKDAATPDGMFAAQERESIAEIARWIEKTPGPSVPGAITVDQGRLTAEATLDFISRQKEKLRSVTADYKPSKFYDTVVNGFIKDAEQAYVRAAAGAGRENVTRDLLKARKDYQEMMETIYDDTIKVALKRNPEDIGRLIWQNGNVSEIEQLHRMLGIAQREGVMSASNALKMQKDVTRGFLQEAVPTVEAAARWSQTLRENPLKRRTWETLTRAPGGSTLVETMKVIEQAAKISTKGNLELVGGYVAPVSRAMSGGMGQSLVTGTIHAGMFATGLSIIGVTKAAATAYTQGEKGVANMILRALRAQNAGTAAGAKAAQELWPKIRAWAEENDVDLAEGAAPQGE